MERVSSYGLSQTLLRSSMALQSRYAQASTQQASGLKSETYGGLGAQSSTLLSLERQTALMSARQSNTQIVSDRVQSMYTAVGDMIDLLSSLRSTVAEAKSLTQDDLGVNEVGRSAREDLAELMNLRLDGRYLFAGASTQAEPVDVSALAEVSAPSAADYSYYQGDSETAEIKISDQFTLSYGVAADAPAFEQALRAAGMLADLQTDPYDQAGLDEAYDLATSALDELIALQSKLSNTASRLDAALARQSDSLALLDEMVSDVKEVDVAETALKLAEYETQLQAGYSALGTVGGLSLLDYL